MSRGVREDGAWLADIKDYEQRVLRLRN